MSVREASPDDINILIKMMLDMREESPALKDVPVNIWRTAENMKAMFAAGTFIGVVDNKGCMLGFVGPNWYSSTVEAFEQMLYVSPEYRNGYSAFRLITAFEKLAQSKGAVSIHVGSSTGIKDEKTAKLYENLGYERSGISLKKNF